MAEDQGKDEEKFDFTPEGEGYISLDEARVLAMRTAVASLGNYGSAYQGVDMFFEVVEATETEDFYYVTLSFRPQGNFDGTPGQEQFVVGKEGVISVRQVHSLPAQTSASPSDTVRKGGGFPLLPVAIGVAVVGIIAAVGAVVVLMGSGGDSVPVAAVPPTETPAPTDTPAPTETLAPTEAPAPPMPTYTLYPTPTPEPTYTPRPTPTARVIVVTPTFTPRPTPTKTPRPTPTPNAISYYEKASEYLNVENWEMAVVEFTNAIQLDSDYTFAYKYRGVAHVQLGKYQAGIADFSKAIQLDPDNSLFYAGRGATYGMLGEYQAGIVDLNKAIQLDLDNGAFYKARSEVYRISGEDTLAGADDLMACLVDNKYC